MPSNLLSVLYSNLIFPHMKTKIYHIVWTLAAICCLSSCSPRVYGLRGNYAVVPSIETTSSFDDVWDRVIDFFAENNIPIATLEKASGIIVANGVNISESLISVENQQGEILDKHAWFVFPYERFVYPYEYIGGKVQCSFNVRVRKQDNGRTLITINLGGISGHKLVLMKSLMPQITEKAAPCYSTGKFEESLLNLFK